MKRFRWQSALVAPALAMVLVVRAVAVAPSVATERPLPAPRDLGHPDQLGRGIQRTMTLLATSTPERRHTVRVLFYGQSITEQQWARNVEADLRRRFPHANLLVENRARGGYAAQNLLKTTEADVYPFQPDLMIFHVYGSHVAYEDIIRKVRAGTTAEILIQTDHVGAKPDWRDEPTDPAEITPKNWDSYMNYMVLPGVIARYGCGYVDQRTLWKGYLRENGLESPALLKDGVHLNEEGNRLMTALVNAALVFRPADAVADPMNCAYVRTYVIGRDVNWEGDRLRLECDGNRIDLIAEEGATGSAQLLIDGQPPSAHPELYRFTPLQAEPGGKWPPVAPVRSQAPLLLEEWELEARRLEGKIPVYAFSLRGSRTGPDGEGRSDQPFVSNSGRVVLEPEFWDVEYALSLAGIKPAPERFRARGRVVPMFVDTWQPAPTTPGVENTMTIAHGLKDQTHVVELRGGRGAVRAIRVYSPKRFMADSATDTGDIATNSLAGRSHGHSDPGPGELRQCPDSRLPR